MLTITDETRHAQMLVSQLVIQPFAQVTSGLLAAKSLGLDPEVVANIDEYLIELKGMRNRLTNMIYQGMFPLPQPEGGDADS